MKTITTIQAWQGEADCQACTIRDSVLFAGLSDDDFSHIHQPIDQFAVPAGGTLYHHNDPGRYLYTVRHGLVKLVNYLPDGSQRIVRLARAADVIGLEVLVEGHYKHDAVILQDAEFCRLPVDVVKRLSSENPQLHQELMKRWQDALNKANHWLIDLSTGSARQRIARLLLMIGGGDEVRCELMSREDMGSILGLTMETVSRIVAEFKRKNIISRNEDGCYDCKLDELDEIAKG
jgi:CRP/FNR family transcriptional regulator, anaerobic regulatory protein